MQPPIGHLQPYPQQRNFLPTTASGSAPPLLNYGPISSFTPRSPLLNYGPITPLLNYGPISSFTPRTPTRTSSSPLAAIEISSWIRLLGRLITRSSSTPTVPAFLWRRRYSPRRTLRCRLLSRSSLCITLPLGTLLNITLRSSRPLLPLHCRLPLSRILPCLPSLLPLFPLHPCYPSPLLLLPITRTNSRPLKKPLIPGVNRSPPSHSNSRSPIQGPRCSTSGRGGGGV